MIAELEEAKARADEFRGRSVAVAGDAHRRHRRPHRRHGARPARPAAQGAARGGAVHRRGRPGPDLGSDHRVARPARGGSGVGDVRVDGRALALAVRRGRRAVQRGRNRRCPSSTSATPRACSTPSSRWPELDSGRLGRGREDLHRRARIVRRRAHGGSCHGPHRPVADQPALAAGRRAGGPARVPRRHGLAA